MDPALLDPSIPSSEPIAPPLTDNTNTENDEGGDDENNGGRRGKGWTIPEDRQLCISWGDVSMDPVVGVKQKCDSYWDSIHANYVKFKEKLPTDSQCNPKSLKNRWGKISAAVTKFTNHYVQAERRAQSGQVIEDILRFAKDLYHAENYHQFAFEHCWVILQNCDKWKDVPEDNGKKITSVNKHLNKRPLTSSSTGSVIDLDDGENSEDLYTTSSISTRPMGIKAAKKARKTRNQDFASSDADLEELAKSNQAIASANAAKAFALQEIAEDKIMSRAPELMEGDRREYYLLKQSKILARIKANEN